MLRYLSITAIVLVVQTSLTASVEIDPNRLNLIQIYHKAFGTGNSTIGSEWINVTSCTSLLRFVQYHGQIGSMNTHNNCVNVYQNEDCSGPFTMLYPGNPFHDKLELWDDLHLRIEAVGTCHHECHETRLENTMDTISVEVFKAEKFVGDTETVEVKPRTCSPLSQSMQGVLKSVKVYPEACIELHQSNNCSGDYRIFPVNAPGLHDLKFWDWSLREHVGSVSLCGYRCLSNQTDAGITESVVVATSTPATIAQTIEITTMSSTIEAVTTQGTTATVASSNKSNSTENISSPNSSKGKTVSIVFTVLICIAIIALVIFLARRFIRQRNGRSGYGILFVNKNQW